MLDIRRQLLLLSVILCTAFTSAAKENRNKISLCTHTTLQVKSAVLSNDSITTHHCKHKIFAALLAMPLGVFGFHRMYLGTSAAVPFAYIASFGGGLGILPFVDFVLIILCKDVNAYAHNPRLFMWSKEK